jgi:hypothetical protein
MFRTLLDIRKTPLQESLLHSSMIKNGNTLNYLRDKKI